MNKQILIVPEHRLAMGYIRENNLNPSEYSILTPGMDWRNRLRGIRGETILFMNSPIYPIGFVSNLDEWIIGAGVKIKSVTY